MSFCYLRKSNSLSFDRALTLTVFLSVGWFCWTNLKQTFRQKEQEEYPKQTYTNNETGGHEELLQLLAIDNAESAAHEGQT